MSQATATPSTGSSASHRPVGPGLTGADTPRSATPSASPSATVRHVTDESFKTEVLASPVPVLVDFWAEWCGPCKMIAPLLDETARSYAGRLPVAKVDVDQAPRIPSEYNIRGIPTLMLFKDGQPAATRVGALSKIQLAAFIEDNI